MAASRHSDPQVPGVVGRRVVVVVVVVVVDTVVVVSGVDVSGTSFEEEVVEVDAKRDLRSILLPIGGSTDGQPANSVVVLTLKFGKIT